MGTSALKNRSSSLIRLCFTPWPEKTPDHSKRPRPLVGRASHLICLRCKRYITYQTKVRVNFTEHPALSKVEHVFSGRLFLNYEPNHEWFSHWCHSSADPNKFWYTSSLLASFIQPRHPSVLLSVRPSIPHASVDFCPTMTSDPS